MLSAALVSLKSKATLNIKIKMKRGQEHLTQSETQRRRQRRREGGGKLNQQGALRLILCLQHLLKVFSIFANANVRLPFIRH
jgi:hypothetical protein